MNWNRPNAKTPDPAPQFAQAEYYYDTDKPWAAIKDDVMWNPRWQARLVRLRPIDDTFDSSNAIPKDKRAQLWGAVLVAFSKGDVDTFSRYLTIARLADLATSEGRSAIIYDAKKMAALSPRLSVAGIVRDSKFIH